MSNHVRENAQVAADAAKRLSDALLADPATAKRFDDHFAAMAADPHPERPDDLKDPGGRR